jgi:hypothetical protein
VPRLWMPAPFYKDPLRRKRKIEQPLSARSSLSVPPRCSAAPVNSDVYMRPRSFRSATEMAPHNARADSAPAGPASSRKITVSISMPAL